MSREYKSIFLGASSDFRSWRIQRYQISWILELIDFEDRAHCGLREKIRSKTA